MTQVRRYRGHAAAVAAIGLLSLLGVAPSASALIITGGPTYSLPGGGTCSVSGVHSRLTGATVTCTGVNLAAHSTVYFGIKNDTNPNGLAMDNTGPTAGEIFAFSSSAASSITYTNATTVASDIGLSGAVSGTMVITRTAGSATVVSTGGTPASNGNGAIERLFRLDSGSSFTFDVDITASGPPGSGQACTVVFDAAHSPTAGGCIGRVDLAFYYSDCGDGQLDSPAEQCDLGGGNGGAPSCCSTSCTYNNNSTVCRAAADFCDAAETCTGSSATCPGDAKVPSGTLCRASAGVCDVQEVCNGVGNACPGDAKSTALCRASVGVCDADDFCDGAGNNCPADGKSTAVCRPAAGACDVADNCDGVGDSCPADVIQPSGVICDAGSGDLCDPDETCDGVGTACPADTITPSGTLCRTGSGDSCDPDEVCTGVADAPCPADVVEPTSTVCRVGSGDLCDPDEFCPGVAAGTCAADVVLPGGTVCNPGSGDSCDPDEVCPGVPAGTCAADTIAPSGTTCRASAGACDMAETCSGTADDPCPSDAKVASGTTCRASVGVCDFTEECDGASDACPADAGQPDDTPCGDGLFCNGDETCQSNVCADGPNPCTFVCDEVGDACSTTACPDNPSVGCRTAQKSKLIIKDKADNSKDKLVWKFIKGQNTTFAELQDPETTANYSLCIYAGTAPAILNVPPNGLKWDIIGNNKGFKYKDQALAAAGVQKVILKASDNGKTKALVKAKGANMPDILGPGPVTGLTTPVTAQLLNHDTGVCFTSTFSTTIKNTPALFKAKNP